MSSLKQYIVSLLSILSGNYLLQKFLQMTVQISRLLMGIGTGRSGSSTINCKRQNAPLVIVLFGVLFIVFFKEYLWQFLFRRCTPLIIRGGWQPSSCV